MPYIMFHHNVKRSCGKDTYTWIGMTANTTCWFYVLCPENVQTSNSKGNHYNEATMMQNSTFSPQWLQRLLLLECITVWLGREVPVFQMPLLAWCFIQLCERNYKQDFQNQLSEYGKRVKNPQKKENVYDTHTHTSLHK